MLVGLIVGLAAAPASGQSSSATSRQAAAVAPPAGTAEFSETSRACEEASRFLANPKLEAAVAAARADRKKAEEARLNPAAFLAGNGVQVPANIRVRMEPSGGGAEKSKVVIKISCCPLSIEIIINL
jgi:hypothetical protein